jgi:curved DNA-binding protein CbpA
LLTVEAFDILALRPGATPSEIKEAYRDLVKVWHPDRFGNDGRLREKAELQLKRINEAYRILQSDSAVAGASASVAESAPNFSPGNMAGAGPSGRGRWMYGGLGLAAILLATYFIVGHDRMHGAGWARDAAARQSAGVPVEQMRKASTGGSVVHSTDSNSAAIRATSGRPRDAGVHQFQVRSLSEAETDRVEMLCSTQRQVSGQAAYRSCLKAQLDVITNPSGKPDLTSLSKTERESIESVCSEARRLRGRDGYNRCATEQVASLAAEPARPELSMLNDVDRHSIESACATAKDREGPAAYNRCLDRMIRTLTAGR